MVFLTKLLVSKITQWIAKLVKQFIQTKVFLFFLALSIGVSYSTIYFVGGQMYDDLFFQEDELIWINKDFIIETARAEEKMPEEVEEKVVWLSGEFTAYTPREEETDEDPFTNASNNKVKDRDIACPKSYAFGTKIEVKGYGVFECWDRMNQRYQDKENFDILFWDLNEAFNFGRKQLDYRIIEK